MTQHNSKKKVLLFGGTGYIGKHVLRELDERGFEIINATRRIPPKTMTRVGNVTSIYFDICNFSVNEDLYNYFLNPDVCIYLAWQDGFNHNSSSHISNLSSHFNVLKNLADNGLKDFSVVGSFREYGKSNGKVDQNKIVDPENLYVLGKLTLKKALELYCAKKDFVFRWLRPFTVVGDDIDSDSIFGKILRWEKEGKSSFPFTMGLEQYDFIDVRVLARMIVESSIQSNIQGVIDCGMGRAVSLRSKIEEFIQENNLSIRPDFGKFPSRTYDSPCIFADTKKIDRILANAQGGKDE